MKPPLLHIGYHKTASTWLQTRLFSARGSGLRWERKSLADPINALISAHPLDFRAEPFRDQFQDIMLRARRRSQVPVVSYERLSGHPFAGGYDSKEIAGRLAEVFPEGRVLIVIREQRDIILSTYRQYVKAGGVLKLESFLDPPTYRHARIPHFDAAYFRYDRLIEAYRELFGAERVLVLPCEQLGRTPKAFVQAILDFADADAKPGFGDDLPFDERMNPGALGPALALDRTVNRWFFRSDVNPAPIWPLAGATGVKQWVQALGRVMPATLASRSEAALRRKVAAFCDGRYAESNARTSRMAGINLGALGYDMPAGR